MKLSKLFIFLAAATLVSAPAFAGPYFSIDSGQEWNQALYETEGNHIRLPSPDEIAELRRIWQSPLIEGAPPQLGEFRLPPELYISDGINMEDPEQEGLVMAWGNQNDEGSDQDISSGWILEYGVDPDLTNCTIKLKVTAPSFITSVTFGLTDLEGDQISWTWSPGSASFPFSPPAGPTYIMIDTNNLGAGINAPTPAATGFAPNSLFDINKVMSFFINETFHTFPGVFNVPAPGGASISLGWNAWDEFEVTPNNGNVTSSYKGYHVKYSQKPEEIEPGLIFGWDQLSYFQYIDGANGVVFMAADDWVCTDPRPVTDFHWWGSFKGWTKTFPPSIVPDYFMIGIWKDVPASPPDIMYSHPRELIWAHKCYKWVWNYAGVDQDPRCNYPPDLLDPDFWLNIGQYQLPEARPCEIGETCFQFNQLLSEDEYFRQEEGNNIYWVSIAAVYEGYTDPRQIPYPWGWKTKPYEPEPAPDIAVIINDIDVWPLTPYATNVTGWKPIILPNTAEPQELFDLCFELTTNDKEPGSCYDNPADLDHDCDVDMADFRLFAFEWLWTGMP